MNFKIQTMTLQDLTSISDQLTTLFDDFWTVATLKEELQNPRSSYLLVKQESEIVGFGGIWRSYEEVHITNIVTRIDKRNLGIASMILEKLIDITKVEQFASITLEVNEKNLSAIHLYEKYQFKPLGIRKRYYDHIDNAMIMTRYV